MNSSISSNYSTFSLHFSRQRLYKIYTYIRLQHNLITIVLEEQFQSFSVNSSVVPIHKIDYKISNYIYLFPIVSRPSLSQSSLCEPGLRAIPTRRLWCDRQYNRPTMAVCIYNSGAHHPVGMAYLLGNWATLLPGDGRRPAISHSGIEQPRGYGPLEGLLFSETLTHYNKLFPLRTIISTVLYQIITYKYKCILAYHRFIMKAKTKSFKFRHRYSSSSEIDTFSYCQGHTNISWEDPFLRDF